MASTYTRNHANPSQKAIGPMATARQAFWPLVLDSLKVGFRAIGKLFSLWFSSVGRRWRTFRPTTAQKVLVRTYLVVEVVVGLALIGLIALQAAGIALAVLIIAALIALVVSLVSLVVGLIMQRKRFKGVFN